ncbi:MAG: hypothetical protein WC412_09100, partial [Candidatus Omnitrophota bacterium]
LIKGLRHGAKPRTVLTTGGTGTRVKAVTIMELLVSFGIAVLIIGAALVFFLTTQFSLVRMEALIHGEEQARSVLSRITSELRLSNAYHITIYNTTGGSDNLIGDAVRFQIPVGSYSDDIYLSSSLAIAWGSNSVADNHIIYSLTDDKTLTRKESDGANIVSNITLARGIKSLIFRRTSSSSNQITVQIDVWGDAGLNLTRAIKSSVSLRN